ncbi:MAG: multidrug ABC transporter, partial [Oscillospiraceae bacterium]|nr:multidrug ABC transporter [Oscillospiraceae bacterium]
MSVSIIIMVCSVFVASISQILLKTSANKNHLSLFKEYFNLYVILGYILLFISTILTIVAFSGM